MGDEYEECGPDKVCALGHFPPGEFTFIVKAQRTGMTNALWEHVGSANKTQEARILTVARDWRSLNSLTSRQRI